MFKNIRLLMILISVILIALILVSSCKDEKKKSENNVSKNSFIYDSELETFIVKSGENELLKVPLKHFSFGTIPEIDEEFNYDPHWLEIESEEFDPIVPENLKWMDPKVSEIIVTDSEMKAKIIIGTNYFYQFKISKVNESVYKFEIIPESDYPVVYTRLNIPSTETENYYGMGEHFSHVAHRGTKIAMQFEIDTTQESGYNEAHVPIPLLISTKGWGLFVEERKPGIFDIAKKYEDSVEITFNKSGLTYYFMSAESCLDIPGLYTQITGAPALPAKWAFAPHQWRNVVEGQDMVLDDARKMREHKIANSVIWIDRPWQTAINTFRFHEQMFPSPQSMIDELHDLGFRVAMWSTPYLDPNTDSVDLFHENNWFIGTPPGWIKVFDSYLVDLTNPDVEAYWKNLVKRVTDMGIEGFKLDYAEDIQIGIMSSKLPFTFFNGEDETTMHHKYSMYYHRPYSELMPEEGGFIISRTGTWGDQIYSSAVWPGDLDNNFAEYGEDEFVGGLIASIIGGLTLSVSGYPYYGSDTGGFRHGRPPKEVLIRWAEQTALSTIMQLGGGGVNHNPWDFTDYGEDTPRYDEETLEIYKKYAELHIRLFPYIYSYAVNISHNHGRPIARPFGMVYPQMNKHPNDQYMFGEWFLVAPIIDENHSRKIILGPGQWMDYWSGKLYEGEKTIDYDAPLDVLPLFLAQGAIVPMLRPGVETLAPVKDDSIDSFKNVPGKLYLTIVPSDKKSEFSLYDGSIVSQSIIDSKIILEYKPGDTFINGIIYKVRGSFEKPEQIFNNAQSIEEKSDKSEFENCDFCWNFEQGSSDTNIIKIKLKAEEKSITEITLLNN